MKTWALARFTLRETIRTKTMIAGLVVSLLYLAVVPMLSSPSGGDAIFNDVEMKIGAGRDFLAFALGGLNFIGMFMAVFTTLGAIYTEIERGTIVSIVSKPVSRWQVIAGKWLGHAMLMGGYVLVMGLALWMSVALGSGALIWSFFPSLLLVCLNVITMVSVTLAFSTFLPVIANAIFVFLILIFTSNLRIVNAIGQASESMLITGIANFFRMMLPVSEVSDLASSVLMGSREAAELGASEAAAFTPRSWSFAYELVYIGAMILIAVWIFRRKDLKAV
jgi:ABC-type transport system involved in multi-copper enzyme maturation permease subunit